MNGAMSILPVTSRTSAKTSADKEAKKRKHGGRRAEEVKDSSLRARKNISS